MIDIAIIGAGPAGLSAAINGKIRNKKVVVFGNHFSTSYLYKAERVDNYLGMYGVSGKEMSEQFVSHAQEMEVEFREAKVLEIFATGESYTLNVENEFVEAKTVILTNGITKDNVLVGENEFLGKGVSYCATCDGMIYKGKTVALIGDSAHAEEEVNYLAEICEKVYYIPLYKEVQKVDERIEIIKDRPVAIKGENVVNQLELKTQTLDVVGVFIIKESIPTTKLLQGLEIENNAIKVNNYMETNMRGIYAAGDCTGKPYQVAKAVGQGTTAGLQAISYLHNN